MEVSLRKPQRLVFKKMEENKGCYLRSYKKTFGASRIYWRLMTASHSPVMNIPPGIMKPFFNLSLLTEIGEGSVRLKEGITLIDKKKRKYEAESSINK